MFNIDFSKLVSDLLPWFHRKPVMVAWLKALISPLTSLYTSFLQERTRRLYEASYNGQIAELEYVLNDYYYNSPTTRDIYIEDYVGYEDTFIYNVSESLEETVIYNTAENTEPNTIIFNAEEGSGGPDFIVWVPDTLIFDQNYMVSLVTKYKVAGPSFVIMTYVP